MAEEENQEDLRIQAERTISLEQDIISPLPTNGDAVSAQNSSPRSEHEYSGTLQDENVNLRRRLAETEYGFQKRLEKQTNLISKLQDRLKDSQRRMADMEAAERSATFAAVATSPHSPTVSEADASKQRSSGALDGTLDGSVLNRLFEEQEKNSVLYDVNITLRQEIDEMRSANFHLTSDLLRVTQLYDSTRREISQISEQSKKTETTYISHLSSEHRQMLNIWRSLQQLRRDFMDTRAMATRGLSSMESEFQRAVKGVSGVCRQFSLRSAYAASIRVLNGTGLKQHEKLEEATAENVEQLIWENLGQLREWQSQKEEEVRQLQMSLEETNEDKRSLETRLLEKEAQIETLKKSLSESKDERDESFVEELHHALRDMADSSVYTSSPMSNATVISPRRRARSHSPRTLRGRAATETTLRIVRDAFERRQREISELSTRLRTTQQRLAESTKPSVTDRDRLEMELNEATFRISALQRERDDASAQKEKLKSQLTSIQSDHMALEKKLRGAFEGEITSLSGRLESAQKRIIELEGVHSRLEDEKEHSQDELSRIRSESAKLRGLLDSSQSSLAELREEVSRLKSTMSKMERENRDLASLNLTLTERIGNETTKNETLMEEINKLASSEKSTNEMLAIKQRDLQVAVKEKETTMADLLKLQKRLEQLDILRNDLLANKEASESEIRQLRDQVHLLQQDKMESSQERTSFVAQLERRHTELKEFETHLSGLRKEYSDTDTQFKLAVQKQQELESQLDSLHRELQAEQQLRSVAEQERHHLTREKSEFEQRVTILMEQVNRLETTSRQIEEKAQSDFADFEHKMHQAESQRRATDSHISEMNKKLDDIFEEKRAAETRMNSLQTILVSQEELLRTKQNERRLVLGKVGQLESQLRNRDAKLKQMSEKLSSLNAELDSTHLEMNKLKEDLDASHNERHRRQTELTNSTTELHRVRLQLTEMTANAEAADERLRTNLDQLKAEEVRAGRLQNELDQCRSLLAQRTETESELRAQLESVQNLLSEYTSSGHTLQEQVIDVERQLRTVEHEKRLLEDRLRDARDQLAKSRKDLKDRSDSVLTAENRTRELETKMMEMESQLRTLQKMLDISQETELDLKRQLEQTSAQKESSHGRLLELQRKCQELEQQKRELAGQKSKLERETAAIKHDLASYQHDRRKKEELIRMAEAEREALDRAVSAIEKENTELHRTVSQLQAQVTKMEQTHAQRLSEISQRHQLDVESEISQLRRDKQDALRRLEHQERMYSQKVKSLLDQLARLKEQLKQEGRHRQEYVSKAIRQSHDVTQLHANLDQSVASLRGDPFWDSSFLPPTTIPRHSTPVRPGATSRLKLSASPGEKNISRGSQK